MDRNLLVGMCGRLPMLAGVWLLTLPGAAQSNGLTLEQTLEVARQRAPRVIASRGRIEEARGRYQGAAVRFRDNPVIETETGPRTRDGIRSADVDVAFSQDFELGGRRKARMAGAQAGIEQETEKLNKL